MIDMLIYPNLETPEIIGLGRYRVDKHDHLIINIPIKNGLGGVYGIPG
jgi:hypothetical protein